MCIAAPSATLRGGSSLFQPSPGSRVNGSYLDLRPLCRRLTIPCLHNIACSPATCLPLSARECSQRRQVPQFPDTPAPTAPTAPQALTEKIVQRYAVGLAPGKKVKSGDYVTLVSHKCMIMGIDPDVQNKSESNQKKYRLIEEFAGKHGIQFYPLGHGIVRQTMLDESFSWSGTVTVASDSHSNIYRGISCLGKPVVRTDAAAILAVGQT
ncbi:hypothetical protein FZEAL_963 [Fusarium zealandicum]|uniref:Aconitase/3-isopropylmalate dehydratase large subunit alpha/beta/alpha domain-containing protein n=1 Tax=Fusarium zealandicum TaxID=1053134 RepID=A0A8H4UUG7_9HYPO|nr:hypothetical protein FZEAL_963 [Fusarium zealandicum]